MDHPLVLINTTLVYHMVLITEYTALILTSLCLSCNNKLLLNYKDIPVYTEQPQAILGFIIFFCQTPTAVVRSQDEHLLTRTKYVGIIKNK